MAEFRLEDFDSYREDNRLEVKKAKGLPNSLSDSYSSMCNTYGGVIILGVAENEDHSWYHKAWSQVTNLVTRLSCCHFALSQNQKRTSVNTWV